MVEPVAVPLTDKPAAMAAADIECADTDDATKELSSPIIMRAVLSKRSALSTGALPLPRQTLPAYLQFAYLTQRQLLKQFRSVFDWLVDTVLCSVVGLALGGIFGSAWTLRDYPTVCVMISLSAASLSCNAALKPFGSNRLLFFRETTAGIPILPRFFAVNLVHCIPICVEALLFTSAFYHLILPANDFWSTLRVIVCICFVSSGFGMLLSVSLPPVPALLVGVIMPLVIGGFLGGVSENKTTNHAGHVCMGDVTLLHLLCVC